MACMVVRRRGAGAPQGQHEPAQIDGNQQPWVLADPARPGDIYVISADSNNGFHQDDGGIRLARSPDSGVTWSSSPIETSAARFPDAAIDQFGDLVVTWYDNRRGLTNAAGHSKLDVDATWSTGGGLTFAPAFPINDQTPGVTPPMATSSAPIRALPPTPQARRRRGPGSMSASASRAAPPTWPGTAQHPRGVQPAYGPTGLDDELRRPGLPGGD